MMYDFEIKENKKHLILKDNSYPLLNEFLLVESSSFDDIILDTIQAFEKDYKQQYFSGNIFSFKINEKETLLKNKLSNEENTIDTHLFIEIFKAYIKIN